jgi:putative flavoprotein involved in K+ transport
VGSSSSPRVARKAGVTIHARAADAGGSTVTFADGDRLDVDAVIWATGFTRDHSWIDAPVFDSDGRIEHSRGVTTSPGLYFLGMPWQHTRGSALLGWVKDDAEHIARRISTVAQHPVERREPPGAAHGF